MMGYVDRRRQLMRKRSEMRKRLATNQMTKETMVSEDVDVVNSNESTNDYDELGGRGQRVRKTVQPYMHMVSPKKKKKKIGLTDEDRKQYINPMHLKQQQIKMTKVSDGGGASTSKSPVNTILNHFQAVSPSRNKNRINYNEDLVDEAFMYEEMLLNTRKTTKTSPTQQQVKNKALTDAVKLLGTEITLVPLSSKKNNSINNNNSSCSSISSSGSSAGNTKLTQSNLSLDGISYYRKPSIPQPSSSSIQISEIKSLCPKKTTKGDKSQQKNCKFCKIVFSDEKQLAVHQLKHLSIAAIRVDKQQILSAHHRRVSFHVDNALNEFSNQILFSIRFGCVQGRMVTMPDGKYIRCLNCWKLYVSNTNLVDHWNNGLCMHYCTVCGQSFHQNIDDLTAHSVKEHGVQPVTTVAWPKVDRVVASSTKIASPKVAAVPLPTSKKVARKKSNATTAPIPVGQPKRHTCSLCKKRFTNPGNLKMHVIKAHNIRYSNPTASQTTKVIRPKTEPTPSDRPHVCPTCDKGFSLESSLMMHMRYHNRKSFDSSASAAAASKTKPAKLNKWQCKVCSKIFSTESTYKEHLRLHVKKTDSDNPTSQRPQSNVMTTVSQSMSRKTSMPLLPKQLTVRRSTISSMPSTQKSSTPQTENASVLMPPPPRSATPMPQLLVPMKYSEVLKYHPPITSLSRSLPNTMEDINAPRLHVKKLVDLQDPNENRRRNSIDSMSQMYTPPEPYSQQNGSTFIIEHRDQNGESMSNGYNDSTQTQQMPPPQAYPLPNRTYHQNTVHQHQYYDPLPSYTNYPVHMPNTTIPMHEHDHGYYANNYYTNL